MIRALRFNKNLSLAALAKKKGGRKVLPPLQKSGAYRLNV